MEGNNNTLPTNDDNGKDNNDDTTNQIIMYKGDNDGNNTDTDYSSLEDNDM